MSDNTISNIMQRCVSLANGDLSPDLRVNYEFGLVLGVDEFRQEQLYFLEKGYLHNRALHGYGTVSGLDVTLQDQDDDIQITVAPGIGIDQFGRTFIIRHEQCASLGAWIAKQQKSPGVVIPTGEDGVITVYLVGTYDECLDALVRIAGQPCSSSDQTTAASRIRDSFNLTLRFAPPAMPSWDAVRRFALVLARVEVDATLPQEDSEEADIIEVVRVLDDPEEFRKLNLRLPGEEPPTGAPRTYRIPAEGANAALDRIFTVWVTEVRPRIAPDLIEPNATGDAESAVLLATIRFRLGAESTPESPVVEGATEELAESVSDEGRPYLLHTQLIQELLLLGNGTDSKPQREFATLHVLDAHTVIIWIHHDAPVTIPPNEGEELQLLVNGESYSISNAMSLDGSTNVLLINSEERIPAGARVELRFNLNAVLVEVDAGGNVPVSTPLIEVIDTLGFNYIGRDGEWLAVYTFAENLPDVREFVSFDTLITEDTRPRIRLWFHAPPPFELNDDTIRVLLGAEQEPLSVQFQPEGQADSPVWLMNLNPEMEIDLDNGSLLTFEFNTDNLRVDAPSLTDAMREEQFSYLGYDSETTLTAHYIVQIPARGTPPVGGITEEQVLELIGRVKTLPFVTITPFITPFRQDANGLDLLECEMWFHLDEDVFRYEAKMQEFPYQILAEIGDDLLELNKETTQTKRNVFTVRIFSPESGFVPGQYTYMRFLFPLDEIFIDAASGSGSLRDYIRNNNVKFEGFFGNDSKHLVAYVRTPANLGG